LLGPAHGADALGETGDFARCRLAVDDALLARARDDRLGFLEGRGRSLFVARGDRLFDLAHRASEAGAPGLVDTGAANGLASGFLRRFGIGHGLILKGRAPTVDRARKRGKHKRMVRLLYSERALKRQPRREGALGPAA